MVDDSEPERARRPAASYVPILHDDATSDFVGLVLVRNFAEAEGEIEPGLPVWILETAFVDDARERYAWMLTRPERWAVWARLAPLVGPEMLTLMMEHEQDRDARRGAELQADVDRLAREARTITARSTEVLGRPCVTLRRGSEREPFFTVPFDDPIERDRLWDWVRWQTGNTGAAIFDAAQPLFITAAMMTRNDFDARFSGEVAAVAARLGVEELHAADLGVGRLEKVAADLLAILRRAGPAFALSRVEKRYHLAGKVIDTLFDPYDNKAVAWQFYNLRPLRMLLVFQVAELLDEPLAGLFWPALMEKRRDRAEAALVSFCRGLAERLDRIDDARLRKVVGDALEWAVENPESFFLVSEDKRQRNGHMPNMVGFGNLIEAIEGQSNRWNRRVETIVHDRQSEFEQSLRFWHRMFTNAKADVVTLPLGEKLVLRKVFGSTLRMSAGVDSAGIQMTDVTLWLFARSLTVLSPRPGRSPIDLPTEGRRALVRATCAAGARIEYHEYAGKDHSGAFAASLPDAVAFVERVLGGGNVTGNCGELAAKYTVTAATSGIRIACLRVIRIPHPLPFDGTSTGSST